LGNGQLTLLFPVMSASYNIIIEAYAPADLHFITIVLNSLSAN
jgi:hypothetical protein